MAAQDYPQALFEKFRQLPEHNAVFPERVVKASRQQVQHILVSMPRLLVWSILGHCPHPRFSAKQHVPIRCI